MEDETHGADGEAVHVPIDGVLDLHTFSPRDLKYLIPDYLDECLKKGILHVRIIHGKGTGSLRRTVHALLERHPDVINYKLGDESSGSWGATLVTLQTTKRPPA